MPYVPLTENQKKLMLEKIGVASFDELISYIPEELKLKKDLDLPEALSE